LWEKKDQENIVSLNVKIMQILKKRKGEEIRGEKGATGDA